MYSVFEDAQGSSDDDLLRYAADEGWVVLTADKDFGELVFRQRLPHCGVVLLRVEDQRAVSVIQVLRALLDEYGDELQTRFTVVTETQARFRS